MFWDVFQYLYFTKIAQKQVEFCTSGLLGKYCIYVLMPKELISWLLWVYVGLSACNADHGLEKIGGKSDQIFFYET